MEFWQANKFFEKLFDVSPDFITILVVGVCIALFILSLFPKKEFSEKLRDISPALMLSAGIIGTFWGTFIALSDFQTGTAKDAIDHNAMVISIPMVLSGMKSAFVTSLIGLLFAFVAKTVFHFLPRAEHRPPIEEEMIDLLKEIKDGLIGENDKSLSSQLDSLRTEYRNSISELKESISGESESSVSSQLERLSDAISGDSETSVLSQLRGLRNENKEDLKNLDGRLEGLSEVIRKSLVDSINSLIKELKDTIAKQLVEQLKETNKLLSDQLNEMLKRIESMFINEFGKTLRQFNEATQAIKKWQEEHRQHVEELTKAFEMTAQGIKKIRADCESIPATMESLKNLMRELDKRLKAFSEMKKQAEESFPVIKKHLDKIGGDLEKSAAGFGGLPEQIENVGKKMDESAQQVIKSSDAVIKAIHKAEKEYKTEIHTTTTAIATEWGEQMISIATKLKEIAKNTKPDL